LVALLSDGLTNSGLLHLGDDGSAEIFFIGLGLLISFRSSFNYLGIVERAERRFYLLEVDGRDQS